MDNNTYSLVQYYVIYNTYNGRVIKILKKTNRFIVAIFLNTRTCIIQTTLYYNTILYMICKKLTTVTDAYGSIFMLLVTKVLRHLVLENNLLMP